MIGMHPLIEAHHAALDGLCRRYHVRRLELFGSAASGVFRPESSDIDFLVEFDPDFSERAFDDYFGLHEELEQLFGRKVDLVCTSALRNPFFIEDVNKSRRLLYAA
jgi:hypothetical protein